MRKCFTISSTPLVLQLLELVRQFGNDESATVRTKAKDHDVAVRIGVMWLEGNLIRIRRGNCL